jgi:hypothetical protein
MIWEGMHSVAGLEFCAPGVLATPRAEAAPLLRPRRCKRGYDSENYPRVEGFALTCSSFGQVRRGSSSW